MTPQDYNAALITLNRLDEEHLQPALKVMWELKAKFRTDDRGLINSLRGIASHVEAASGQAEDVLKRLSDLAHGEGGSENKE